MSADFNLNAKNLFSQSIQVHQEDLDMNNHVNNEIYLKWMLQIATAHSEFVGYPFQKYREIYGVFVVRRHEIDYIAPARLGDKLNFHTYSEPMSGCRAIRKYLLSRDPDKKVILEATTHWTFIDTRSSRPILIPNEVAIAFSNEQEI